MDIQTLRQRTAITLRFLGYICCILGWLWLAIIALPPLIESGAINGILPDETTPKPVIPVAPQPGISPVASLAVGIITLIMLTATFFILWRLPRTVVKSGDKIVEATAESVLPVVTHHRKLPAKRQRQLSRRLAFIVRLLAMLIPFAVIFFLPSPSSLNKEVVMAVAAAIAAFGVLLFIAAQLIDSASTTSRTRLPASRG